MKANLKYGKSPQLVFSSKEEFFESLGVMAKPGCIVIVHEDNDEQGAWGKEKRIHIMANVSKFPPAITKKFTAGVGNVLHRVNCNEFVEDLVDNHGFMYGNNQPYSNIRTIVQKRYTKYLSYFDFGYSK